MKLCNVAEIANNRTGWVLLFEFSKLTYSYLSLASCQEIFYL